MVEDNTYVITGPPPLQPIPNISLGRLIFEKLLENCGDNDALVEFPTGDTISYKTIFTKSCALAAALEKKGYGRNTIITVCSANCKEFFIPVLAALYIGAIVAPVNHSYTKYEMVHALNITKPKLVFCAYDLCTKFRELQEKLCYIDEIVTIDSNKKIDGTESLDTFIGSSDISCQITGVNPVEQVALILCSSGTTGLPKGVMITHENVLTSFMHSADSRFQSQEEGRCTLGVLPFYHSYGMFRGLHAIYKQIKIIVLKKFDEDFFLGAIQQHRISLLSLVPPLAIFLAKSPKVEKYDLSSVTEVSCGAAPLSRDIEELLKRRLKLSAVRQAYGLTETTLRVTGMPWGQERFGSSGKLCPYLLCKVRDPETGKSLGPNQVGELCFKGPSITKGYYNNEEANKNSFTSDGWFMTGDLGYYDEEEYFYVVDRLKELIKYKGFQVPPAELEALLLTNPRIKDAAVIGVPDDDAGELPLAFVVKNPGVNLSEKEVIEFVAERVSPQKWLRGGVLFVTEIPKIPSGKILRRKLKEMLKSYKSKL